MFPTHSVQCLESNLVCCWSQCWWVLCCTPLSYRGFHLGRNVVYWQDTCTDCMLRPIWYDGITFEGDETVNNDWIFVFRIKGFESGGLSSSWQEGYWIVSAYIGFKRVGCHFSWIECRCKQSTNEKKHRRQFKIIAIASHDRMDNSTQKQKFPFSHQHVDDSFRIGVFRWHSTSKWNLKFSSFFFCLWLQGISLKSVNRFDKTNRHSENRWREKQATWQSKWDVVDLGCSGRGRFPIARHSIRICRKPMGLTGTVSWHVRVLRGRKVRPNKHPFILLWNHRSNRVSHWGQSFFIRLGVYCED